MFHCQEVENILLLTKLFNTLKISCHYGHSMYRLKHLFAAPQCRHKFQNLRLK
jgi:hypothetical protein